MPEETVRLIIVDTSITLPLELTFEGSIYKLQPDGEVPKRFADKMSIYKQYEVYDSKNSAHVKLLKNKDKLFEIRSDYGKFDLMKEFEKLSPDNRDKVINFVKSLLNPVIDDKGATDPITDAKLKKLDLPPDKPEEKKDK